MAKWSPSAKYCASVLHMLASLNIIQAGYIHGLSILWTAILLTVISAVKEFWADLTWLEHDSLLGSTLDFVMYQAGMWIALLSLPYLREIWFFVAIALVVAIILLCMYLDMRSQEVL